MEEIEIRELLPDDAEQILAYTREVGGETGNLTFGAEGLPFALPAEQEYLRSVKANAHSVMLGAFAGSRLVCIGDLSGMPRRMNHVAELGLSVLKEYWNRRIGSRMLESLIAYAGEHGIELIYLKVRSDNASAIHLYSKFGFRKTGSYPAYLKIGDAYFDCDLMALDLRQKSE